MHAVPSNWFSWNYDVSDRDGPLTRIDLGWLRETGGFELGGRRYRLARRGWLGHFELRRDDGRLICRAAKPSAFRRLFEIDLGDDKLILEAESIWGRGFVLRRRRKRAGVIRPESPLSRRIEAELPEELAAEVQVFLLWLVILVWRRHASAAST
ncbi:MAG: hypothetical protein D6696_03875 [Acidobacteria bacterium]|nr:MAG: hypothetical protein D6696_03875 [Acidobacteriota bacterium]